MKKLSKLEVGQIKAKFGFYHITYRYERNLSKIRSKYFY